MLDVLQSHLNQHGIAEVTLPDLTDSNNKNMLMLATISNRLNIVTELFCNGFGSSNVENMDKAENMAVDYAWLNCDDPKKVEEADQIFNFLLRQNSVFPKDFSELRAPKNVKAHIEICSLMRKYVNDGNTAGLKAMIDANKDQRHFYDSSNKSLFTHTLEIENEDMLSLLKSKNIIAGMHEDNTELFENIRTKNIRNSSSDPINHIEILKTKINISHGEVATPDKFRRRDKMLNFLNKSYSTILKTAALWNKMRIVMDFTKYSTERVDPSSSISTTGVIFNSGDIVIGALNLMSGKIEKGEFFNNNELKCYGVFLHEIIHCAVYMTFMNNFNPYPMGESELKNKFIAIFNEIKAEYTKKQQNKSEIKLEDEIVYLVFGYPKDQQHSELIVRSAQMDVTFHNDSKTRKKAQQKYFKLYEFFKTYMIPEFLEAIRVHKLLNDKTFAIKFNDLTSPMKAKIKHSPIIFQGVETTFYNMFGDNEQSLRNLSSELIREFILDNMKIEIFDDFPCTMSDTDRVFKQSFINRHQKISNSRYLLKKLENERIVILSAEPGAGKTKLINDLAWKMKQKFQTFFISIIKPNEHLDVIRNFINTPDLSVSDILHKIFIKDNEFESNIFDHLLSIGKAIFIFDDIHLIEPDFILKFFERIKTQKNIRVWIITRPRLQQPLEKLFSTASYEFIPISQKTSSRMLLSFLKNLNETKGPKNLMSVLKILEEDRFDGIQVINCPVILECLAKIYVENDIDFQPNSLNLHNILEKCINELEVHFSSNIPRHINILKWNSRDFEVLALKTDFGPEFYQRLEPIAESLAISLDWKGEQERRIRDGKIEPYMNFLEQLGLFSLPDVTSKVKALHMIVTEFHLAQLIIKYLFNENRSISDEENRTIIKLLILTASYPEDFKMVHKIIYEYTAKTQTKCRRKVSKILQIIFKRT